MPAPAKRAHSVWLEFLGSMNLAITLLVAIAIASVIGTVLQQNEPYQNYIIKFGPFWFEVFDALGLYDVYSAVWFMAILAFLVTSTSVCIYRNAPVMLREARSHRERIRRNSLLALHHQAQWQVATEPATLQPELSELLRRRGYRVRASAGEGHALLAAMRGGANRYGYIFTHAAIVIICIGGLVDGNVPLKLKEALGEIRAEIRDIPASQVPPESRLPVTNPAFRGNVNIPEGSTASLVFLQLREGYLVQPLPFSIELKDFRIEHYPTGQPKSFESDLVIRDPDAEAPVEATIAVNHPLIYKGHAIYQASFADGGSELGLRAWPLDDPRRGPSDFEAAIFDKLDVTESVAGGLRLELTDFRLFNINPVEAEDGEVDQRNFGPNFTFRVRQPNGAAREYENYMLPVPLDGRQYFLSGMRESQADPFFYLHLPADRSGSLERFMRFRAALFDDERVGRLVSETTAASLNQGEADAGARARVDRTMRGLVGLFATGGFNAVVERVNQVVPEAERNAVLEAYVRVLHRILSGIYMEVLAEEGVDVSAPVDDFDAAFYDDAVNAFAALPEYGSPFYLQLTDFNHIQSSGLQIAKAPGKNVVYLGFALLILGVFMMFYIAQRRLWVWLEPDPQGGSRVLLGGSANRGQREFDLEFEGIRRRIERRLVAN